MVLLKSMDGVCISVAKSWLQPRKDPRKAGMYGGKRHLCAYFISEDDKIYRKRVGTIEAQLLKLQIHHRITVHCTGCGAKLLKLVKNKKDKVNCPSCGVLI